MEALKYLIVVLIGIIVAAYGIFGIVRGIRNRDRKTIFSSIFILIITAISGYFYLKRTLE